MILPDIDVNSVRSSLAQRAHDLTDSTVCTALVDAGAIRELHSVDEPGASLHEYSTQRSGTISPPAGDGPYPPEIDEKIGSYTIEQPTVAEFRDAQLVGPDALTVARDGAFVLENALRSNYHFVRALARAVASGVVPCRRSATDTVDVAVSLVGPWSDEYFHWFADWLPRLEGVVEYTRRTGLDPTLLVPPDPPAWMTDSLEAVGFGSDAWTEWGGGRVAVSRLVVPSLRWGTVDGSTGYINAPDGYRWVRERVVEHVETDGVDTPERVYISRSDAAERRVLNEGELVAALRREGYERLVLSELSFAEQVATFAGATHVVAPHGAGLVNTMYGESLDVVELFGEYVNPCYFVLSETLEYDYRPVTCRRDGEDLVVDVQAVLDVLNRDGG